MSRWDHGPKTLLKNLQSYKLVTGQLDPNELYRQQRRKLAQNDNVYLDQGAVIGSVLHESLRELRPTKRRRQREETTDESSEQSDAILHGASEPKTLSPTHEHFATGSAVEHTSTILFPFTPTERGIVTRPTELLFPGYRAYDDALPKKRTAATEEQNVSGTIVHAGSGTANTAPTALSELHCRKPVDFFGLTTLFEDEDGSDSGGEDEGLRREEQVRMRSASPKHDERRAIAPAKPPHMQPINALDALAGLYGDSDSEEEQDERDRYVQSHSYLQSPSPKPSSLHDWDKRGSGSAMGIGKVCWKCQKRGHLAEDCARFPDNRSLPVRDEHSPVRSKALWDYHRRVQRIQKMPHPKCVICGVGWNLAFCLDCDMILCDGKGHLTDHMIQNPSHGKLYSFKLRRQIKCSNPSCEVIDARELRRCATCLSKAFDADYDLINATWSRRGLIKIPKAISCDDHFHWHRLNCDRSHEFYSGSVVSQEMLESGGYEGTLSEHLF